MLIKGGTLVNADGRYQADIKIHNDKIVLIQKEIRDTEEEVIDASGCYVFAGFIDPHTHFALDTGSCVSPDDFSSGTKAALMGGTTTILDFATAFHGETLKQGLMHWHRLADHTSSCNYGFHMAFTDWNEGLRKEIHDMIREGITSFKVYMAYDALKVSNHDISEILKEIKQFGGLVGCHCEIGDLVKKGIELQKKKGNFSPSAHPLSRPDNVEAEAIRCFLEIGAKAEVPVCIVHLSTEAGLEEIRKARKNGSKVYVETCPQYLLLDERLYHLAGFESAKYTLSPPLRKKADQEQLWKAMKQGEIDTVATDHCSFNLIGQKTLGKDDFSKIPNGIPGVGNRPELIYTYGVCKDKISLEQMAAMLSEHAAKEYGMYPKKGRIQEGSDADLVVWNPNTRHVITQNNQYNRTDYTPYEGMQINGRAEHVIVNGFHAVKHAVLKEENKGLYVKRGPVWTGEQEMRCIF